MGKGEGWGGERWSGWAREGQVGEARVCDIVTVPSLVVEAMLCKIKWCMMLGKEARNLSNAWIFHL